MIGILDSGLSSLRLAAAVRKILPAHDILLYAHTASGPWGIKGPDTIRTGVMQAAHFLVEQGARLLLLASNSASATSTEQLKRYTQVPLLEAAISAAETALNLSGGLKIGVLGSPATVSSGFYETVLTRLNPAASVFSSAGPLVLPLVESGWLKKPETRMILKKYLHPLKARQVDTLICAGGHFGLLESVICRKMGRHVTVVDPYAGLTDRLKEYLKAHPHFDRRLEKGRRLTCIVSDLGPYSGDLSALYFGSRVRLRPAPVPPFS